MAAAGTWQVRGVEHQGACHCGGVVVRLTSERAELPIRRCTCSHCAPQHFRYTSDPDGSAAVTGDRSTYRFGTGTASFERCAGCGFFIGAFCDTDGLRAVLNADLFESLRHKDSVATDLTQESVEERLARRSRTWTPVAPAP